MKTIKAGYIIEPVPTGKEILTHLEKIGRVCYKSEDKITDGSAEKFLAGIVKRGHEAMIEHHNFVCKVGLSIYTNILSMNPKFLKLTETYLGNGEYRYIVSGSARGFKDLYKGTVNLGTKKLLLMVMAAIVNKTGTYVLFSDIAGTEELKDNDRGHIQVLTSAEVDKLTNKERMEHTFVTVKFTNDRGVSHETVRHRPEASFAQESTRYCNYANDKFGSEINAIDIRPGIALDTKMKDLPVEVINAIVFEWEMAMADAEHHYNKMIKLGATAQIARGVLPTSLKTEIVVTMSLKEWNHFFSLRTEIVAHPQMREVAVPLCLDFKNIYTGLFDNIPVTA